MKETKIKVLALFPMELPKEIELDNTLEAMQKFANDCVNTGNTKTVMTVVDVIPEEQIKASEEICRKTGAKFRVRAYEC